MSRLSRNYLPALYLFVSLVGIWFLTKSWLPGDQIIAGHDSGLALNTKDFLFTRLYAWDPQGFGHDNSMHFGSIMIHGVDYLLSLIAGAPYAGNQPAVFFWLSFIFVGAFIFALNFERTAGPIFPYIFPVFTTFNFFIIQSIFILERAKYNVYVLTMLFFLIAYKYIQKKIPLLKATASITTLFLLLNSGSWLGLPLYGGFGLLVAVFLLWQLLMSVAQKKLGSFMRSTLFVILALIVFVLINSYSIFPYLNTFTKSDVSVLSNDAILAGNREWLDTMSKSTSFLNIFRLQGIPDWYSESNVPNPAHAYSSEYLSSNILVISSFAIPVLVFSSLLLAKNKTQRELVSFFNLLLLSGIVFMAGTHPPTGQIFGFIFEHVPGFVIFRSAFFKFGGAYLFAVSFLLGFTLSRLFSTNKALVNILLACVIIAVWLNYHSVPFSDNKIFNWNTGQQTNITPPRYISEFAQWANENIKNDERVLLFPPLNKQWKNDAYDWGYWSLAMLPSMLTSKSVISNDQGLTHEETAWVESVYQNIHESDEEGLARGSKRLGIKYILVRNDILDDGSWSAIIPETDSANILKKFESMEIVGTFGRWDLLKINTDEVHKIYAINQISTIPSNHTYLGRVFLKERHFTTDNTKEFRDTELIEMEVTSHTCESCRLEGLNKNISLPGYKILPGSTFYFLKQMRESKIDISKMDQAQKVSLLLSLAIARVGESKILIDQNAEDNFVAKNIEKAKLYLESVNSEVSNLENNSDKFYIARRVADVVNPTERFIRDEINKPESKSNSAHLNRALINLLWQTEELGRYLNETLGGYNELKHQKTYFLDLNNTSDSKLYIVKDTLARSRSGGSNLPSTILLKKESGEVIEGKTLDPGNEFIEINFENEKVQAGKLTLTFDQDASTNLFSVENLASKNKTPSGEFTCLVGTIINFDKNKYYSISIHTKENNKSMRMYIKDKKRLYSEDHKYLQGEDEADIIPKAEREVINHLYIPSKTINDSEVYLCLHSQEPPDIEKITVEEIFSPQILSVVSRPNTIQSTPNITYKQINPTRYSVKITNNNSPFILVFNERFSPLWQINGLTPDPKQSTIDGYANGWLIDQSGDLELTITYKAQRDFYIGATITSITVIALFIFFKKNK